MTTTAGLDFPSVAAELKALPNSKLAALIKKIDDPAVQGIENIKSIAHLMPKAKQVDFLSWHVYGVGSKGLADDALAVGKKKYAAHIEQLAAKKGSKAAAPAAKVKGGKSTNCAATLAKGLAEAVDHLTPGKKLIGDLDGWAKSVIADKGGSLDLDDFDVISKFRSDLGNILVKIDSGDIAAALGEADEIKATRHLITRLVQTSDNKLDSLDDLPKIVALRDELNKAQQALWEIKGEETTDLLQYAGIRWAKVSSRAKKVSSEHLDDIIAPWVDDVPTTSGQILSPLEDLAHLQPDKVLLPHHQTALIDHVSDALDPTAPGGLQLKHLTDVLDPDDLESVAQLAEALSKKAWVKSDDALVEAVSALKKGSAQALDAAQSAASNEILDEAIDAYKAYKSKDLKKLAGDTAEQLGYPKSLGKSYMDKDVAASFVAKADQGLDVSDEIAKAEAKYAAHKAKQAGGDVPKAAGADVADDYKASTHVADTTDKSADDALAASKADPESALYDHDTAPTSAPPAPEPDGPVTELHTKKPAQVEHTWSPNPQQQHLSGAHRKETWLDENGDVWMWKKTDTAGVAHGEITAHEIGWRLGVDMADIRYAKGWQTQRYGRQAHGTIQKFHKGVQREIGTPSSVDFSRLTAEQLREVQEHQVFDWLISQHDTHGENLLVLADGHLAGIDKGQAFKAFGKDRLERGWKLPGNFGDTVYNGLWDEYVKGRLDLDLDAVDDILRRIEGVSDAEYRELLRPYVAQRMEDGGASLSFLPKQLQSEDAFLDALVERKRRIREDFTAFYKDQAADRGVSWTPRWEGRVAEAAEEATEEAKQAARAGITTPVDDDFSSAVRETNAAGKSLHLAGEEITYGQALVWTEKAEDAATDILRLELRLEQQADARLMKLLESEAGTAGTGNAYASGAAPADEFPDILAGIKTVKHHADDGDYNTDTIAAMKAHLPGLEDEITKATQADADLLAGKIDLDEWADIKATGEKATIYRDWIRQINKAYEDKTKPPPSLVINQYDKAKAAKAFKADPPKGWDGAAAVEKAEPEALFVKKPTADTASIPDMEAVDGLVAYKRTGGMNSLGYSDAGKLYHMEMEVEGRTIVLRYQGHKMTHQIPRQGLMDVEIVGWDGSSDDIRKVLTALNRLGVDTHLATETDEALTYWRVLTRSYKNSVEYATGNGTGPYGKVREMVDTIENRVHSNMSPTEELAAYRDEWTKVFGSDVVERAPERLVHNKDLLGRETGYGHVLRPDLPDDLSDVYRKGRRQVGIAHGIQTTNFEEGAMVSLPGPSSGQELARLGQFGKKHTTSMSSDMGSGGATGIYGSQGYSHWQAGRDVVILNPSTTMRRVSTYSFPGDQLGRLSDRTVSFNLDPSKWNQRYMSGAMKGGNETVVRHAPSWGDDIELVFTRSQAKRDAIIANLKKNGVDEIRGVPVEQRVIFARTDSQVVETTAKVFEDKRLYRRTYGEAADSAPKIQGVTEAADPPPRTTVSDITSSAAGGAQKAAEEAAKKTLEEFDVVGNSVKKKLPVIFQNFKYVDDLNISTYTDIKKELQVFLDLGYTYGHASDLSKLSKVKQLNAFVDHLKAKAQVADALKGQTTAVSKLKALEKIPTSGATKQATEEALGDSLESLAKAYGADDKGADTFQSYLVKVAKEKDGVDPDFDILNILQGDKSDLAKAVDAWDEKGTSGSAELDDLYNLATDTSTTGSGAHVNGPALADALGEEQSAFIQEMIDLKEELGSVHASVKAKLLQTDPAALKKLASGGDGALESLGKTWTPEQVAKLKKFADGDLPPTSGAIMDELGISPSDIGSLTAHLPDKPSNYTEFAKAVLDNADVPGPVSAGKKLLPGVGEVSEKAFDGLIEASAEGDVVKFYSIVKDELGAKKITAVKQALDEAGGDSVSGLKPYMKKAVAESSDSPTAVGKLQVLEEPSDFATVPGQKVKSDTVGTVYGYKFGAKKVEVAFKGTGLYAKYEGEWYFVATKGTGKIPKQTALDLLNYVGYPDLPETV